MSLFRGPEAGSSQAFIASRIHQFHHFAWRNVPMAQGFIKKLTGKHFGFIKTEDDEELFFHASSVRGVSFDELHESQEVSYTEEHGPRGPYAENVKPV
jgi:CspA family cold shock protein